MKILRTENSKAAILAVLLLLAPPIALGEQPIDVLRNNVEQAINVLKDPRYQGPSQRQAQRDRLCEIAKQMFNPGLFSKLVLASNWKRFTTQEKTVFIDVFSTFMCKFYLSRLQEKYRDEQIVFLGQDFKSDTVAAVKAEVLWQGLEVPVEVRMAFRDGAWKAYDIRVAGISAVLLYRAQFQTILRKDSPGDIIKSIEKRIESGG